MIRLDPGENPVTASQAHHPQSMEIRIACGRGGKARKIQLTALFVSLLPNLCAWDSREFRELCRPRLHRSW